MMSSVLYCVFLNNLQLFTKFVLLFWCLSVSEEMLPSSNKTTDSAESRRFSKWFCWNLDLKCSLSSNWTWSLYSHFSGVHIWAMGMTRHMTYEFVLCIFISFRCINLQKNLLIKLQRSHCFKSPSFISLLWLVYGVGYSYICLSAKSSFALNYKLPESSIHHNMRKARERRPVPSRSPRAVR